MLRSSPSSTSPRRQLKRSASTASLPTPPRTQRRKRRNGKLGQVSSHPPSDDSASDVETLSSSDDRPRHLHKKPRVSRIQEAQDEDAFWLAGPGAPSSTGSTALSQTKPHSSASESDGDSDSPIPVLERRKRALKTGGTLASPPPSHRKTTTVKKSTSSLVRDSPNNPFLDDPFIEQLCDDDENRPASPFLKPFKEKPTIAYVFRGQRRVVANPHWDHEHNEPIPVNPQSLLPPEHPDYVTDFRCPPVVLFPNRRQARRLRAQQASEAAGPASQLSTPDQSEAEPGSETELDALVPGSARTQPNTNQDPGSESHLRAPGPPLKSNAEDSW